MKQKNKLYDILYITLIVCLILFMIFAVFFLQSNAIQCLKQPVQYYQEKNEAQCFCISNEYIKQIQDSERG